MPWAKVGDEWWCHPKVMGIGLAPRGLWVSALSWSCAQRKDIVPVGFLAMVGGSPADAQPLVDAGLWVVVDGGWRIHDWFEYQQATVNEKRAEAGRKGGVASGKARRSEANGKQTEASEHVASEANAEAGPIPSLPNPSISTPAEAIVPADPIERIAGYVRGAPDAAKVARRTIAAAPDPLTREASA